MPYGGRLSAKMGRRSSNPRLGNKKMLTTVKEGSGKVKRSWLELSNQYSSCAGAL
tara:strand:+ start:1206 stop:1370 length:165 start_codon:yes stop_codon:yes gene_type:complete